MVLVTGGTGFLGAYIIKELVEKGYPVRAIRRSDKLPFYISPAIFEKVEWLRGDILDVVSLEEAMEGADAVIHAAAKVSFSRSDRRELFHTNIEGTANVVNMALAKNLQRFVHISSVAALGRTAGGERVSEDKKWEDSKLNTNYAISKFHGEMEVWRGIGEGLPAVIVNPSTILGYGDWDTSSSALFKNSFREFPWYSNGVNGFVDVADTARAVVALLENDVRGERYILNGDNWSFRQLFNQIAREFGKKQPSREATPLLGEIAWRMEKVKTFFSGKPSLLTRESARIARTTTFFDNSKILRQLPGFVFTPLEQTIRAACQAYLKHLE
ncbi:MAG TPA: NAD-dependent epimerase/dehydratase family protein [Puia sp.]|jgi:nucleoside-diphosphate-sugar epimerase|nr:NAD-dependent epimerase/dehydratase family protein [Puia sp.]